MISRPHIEAVWLDLCRRKDRPPVALYLTPAGKLHLALSETDPAVSLFSELVGRYTDRVMLGDLVEDVREAERQAGMRRGLSPALAESGMLG
jgi:hypothetical protein